MGEAKDKLLFEVSWEVCNRVGGIYTVLKSKAAKMASHYRQGYFAVGPYFQKKVAGEFQEEIPTKLLKDAFEELKNEGILCHYGRWLVDGEPSAVLIDFSGFAGKKNEIKTELWNSYKIDSLYTQYFDFDEPIIWGYAAGKLIEAVSKISDKKVVAHMHEWLSGSALLYLRNRNAAVAKVFTTHATVLGRAISSSGADLYTVMEKLNPEEEAYKRGIQAKHQTERQCAHNADVFTTVSEITALEAERLLGKKPDMLLENGIDSSKFPTFEEAVMQHRRFKRRIKAFMQYYFFPYYTFDLEDVLIYFICGRYELHDKGVDIFIKALARLNAALKKENGRTIVAFFWIPANTASINPELFESKTFYEDVKESVHHAIEGVSEKIIYSLISKKKYSIEQLLGKDIFFEAKKKVLRLSRKGSPPLSTHKLHDEDKDQILGAFRESGLLNRKEDKVKVVYYPTYLTGADGLLDLNHYESMHGAHLGVFPSCYEPWGYTPLEAAALGVPAITTDLAGFGRYIYKSQQKKFPGIFVMRRLNRTDEQAAEELAGIMHSFSKLSREERIKNKIEAKHASELANWETLVAKYFEAHRLASEKFYGKRR